MSKTDKNDDFAVFDNKDEQLQHPTGDLDLEVSSDGKDVSGDGEVIERQEPEPKPELESAHDAEVDESLENQYLEEEEKEVAEPIYTEIPDDEEPNRSSSGKSNVLLWCVTGISLLFAAGGVYTGLNAQTQAKVMQVKLRSYKSN
ncbi:hypothetical protein [Photobacterium phosphoreum]|uniref:hypothetical protein n=1 Tax=Photobacterium phosphoreum TaxID=659 RepID=UPI001E3BF017|nr:hypothetical protein [Photobacterium phosphoreum]MCD9480778.1 hypothetical protein [Photobacterium phosphoreum]